jgi:uncharacterized protein
MATERTSDGRRAALLALGFGAGFASALFGIGGGLVMVPVLTIALGVPVKRAVGTSLAAIVPVSATGVVAELLYRPENVRWAPAGVIAIASVAAAEVGARLVRRLPARGLSRLFAAFVVLAALKMLGVLFSERSTASLALSTPSAVGIAALLAIGAAAGLTASLFGIGGGIVVVPALAFLSSDIPVLAARATSLVTIVPTSLVGALAHRRFQHVDFEIARHVVPLAFLGSIGGVVVANHVGEVSIARTFGVFLLAAAAWIFFRPDPATSGGPR